MAPSAGAFWEVRNWMIWCIAVAQPMPHTFCWYYDAREESILEDIAPEELHSKLQDPSFIEEAQLIDVREPEEVYVSFLYSWIVIFEWVHKKKKKETVALFSWLRSWPHLFLACCYLFKKFLKYNQSMLSALCNWLSFFSLYC